MCTYIENLQCVWMLPNLKHTFPSPRVIKPNKIYVPNLILKMVGFRSSILVTPWHYTTFNLFLIVLIMLYKHIRFLDPLLFDFLTAKGSFGRSVIGAVRRLARNYLFWMNVPVRFYLFEAYETKWSYH